MEKTAIINRFDPKTCISILSGKQKIFIADYIPKEYDRPDGTEPFKVYVFSRMPTEKRELGLCVDEGKLDLVFMINFYAAKKMGMEIVSGKVIGEFLCTNIREIPRVYAVSPESECKFNITDKDLADGCFDRKNLKAFAGSDKLYAWEISDVVFYEKPKCIEEFHKPCECSAEIIKFCDAAKTGCLMTTVRSVSNKFVYVKD